MQSPMNIPLQYIDKYDFITILDWLINAYTTNFSTLTSYALC